MVSKSKINKPAKLLNGILLLEGLEHVAGEMIIQENQCSTLTMTTTSSSTPWTMWVIVIFLVMIAGGLALAGYMMWQKIKKITEELEEMKEAQRVDGMMIDAVEHGRKEEVAVLGSLIQVGNRNVEDPRVFREMEYHYPYLDSPALKF